MSVQPEQPDQFHWWREALAGRVGEIHEDQPQPGYYWMRDGRDGPRLPVAIWRDAAGQLVCRAADKIRNAVEIWTWVAKNPVSEVNARQAFATGSWPGDVPQGASVVGPSTAAPGHDSRAATSQSTTASSVSNDRPAPSAAEVAAKVAPATEGPSTAIGGNSKVLTLIEEIEDAAGQALDWLNEAKIDNQIAADMAGNWRQRMLSLAKRADAQRVDEKRPHDEAAKAVQTKWKSPIDRAEAVAVKLRLAVEPFLKAEDARLKAEAAERARAENERRMADFRKAEEARKAALAEAQAKAAEAAQAAAADAKPVEVPAVEIPAEPQMPEFVAPDAAKAMVGGQRGRRTGLRTQTAYEISDYEALLAHVKDHPDVRAMVEKIGRAQSKAGAVVPGITVTQVQVAA